MHWKIRLGIWSQSQFWIDHTALCACEHTRHISTVVILQGRKRAKKGKDLPLTDIVCHTGCHCPFFARGAEEQMLCATSMLLWAKEWVWTGSCARDYVLRPSSHFLCLHSLSGQKSLWGVTLPTEVKARGIPENFESSSSDDLVAKVF